VNGNGTPDEQRLSGLFRRMARGVSTAMGSPVAFLTAFFLVLVWAVTGPIFGFSDTWQLVINTSTTIVTFLMVFLIQNTQNRDNRALHMKLDELIVYTKGADNSFVELENLSDEELNALEEHFHRLAKRLGHEDLIAEAQPASERRSRTRQHPPSRRTNGSASASAETRRHGGD
jgi:low affinity Fe/Cu permease